MIDWRANRLVDALAKAAAANCSAPGACAAWLADASRAVRHHAMLVGRVTHAANNHEVAIVGPDGSTFTKVVRDAAQAEVARGQRAPRAPAALAPPAAPAVAPPPRPLWPPSEWPGPSPVPPPLTPVVTAAARRRSAAEAALQQIVEERGASLAPPVGRPPAAERLAAVRRRVLARLAG